MILRQQARLVVPLAAVAVVLSLPGAAIGAWAPALPLAGPSVQLGLVTSGQAGVVAVAGTAVDGALLASGHTPGAAFGLPLPAGAGSEDFPALIGRGGAITSLDGGRPTIRRLRADGSVSAPVAVGGTDDTIVGRPAIAPSGALLVVVTDSAGDAELWRQPGDGQPAIALTFNVPDGASIADIAATGSDQFVVGLAAPNVNDAPGVRVRTITVTGTAGAAGAPVETTSTSGDVVNEMQVVPGPQPGLVYTLITSAGSAVKVSPVASPAPLSLATADGETAALDGIQGAATAAGFAVSWTLTSEGGTATTGFAVLPSPGADGCRGSVGFELADLVDRGGPVLVGLDGDGAVGITTTDATCAAAPPVFSAPVADAGDLTADIDTDGTVLALVGRGEAGASTVVPDDVTPPVLGALSVPSAVRPGEAIPASIDATDPWGLTRVAWTVDGAEVAQGASVTLPRLATGSHRIEATATNAAGLTATRGADVVVPDRPTPIPAVPMPIAPSSGPAAPSALTLTRLAVDPTCIRYGAPFTGTRKRLSFSFDLSEAASVRLTIQRRLNSGVLRRCPSRRTPGQAGRLGTPVVVDVASGVGPGATLVGDEGAAIAARAARVAAPRVGLTLTRRVRRGRSRFVLAQAPTTLGPGTYVAQATGRSADGRRTGVSKVKFWVLPASVPPR